MKIKRILALLILMLVALALFSCKKENDQADKYPEGAIPLTAENLSTYFDIKVTTDCLYDYDYDQTRVFSYVALVPKGAYKATVGEVSFELNARVRQYGLGTYNWRVSSNTHTLRLKEGDVTNTEIRATVNGGGGGVSSEYVPIKENNNITLKTVSGYVMLGERAPYGYELITNAQREESPTILAELTARVDEFKESYDSAESFNYLSQTRYNLGSIYGVGKSESNTTTHNGVTVDYKNDRFKIGDDVYYSYYGQWLQQSLGVYGFVSLSPSGMTLDDMLSEYPPVWEIFDASAVYTKEGENCYVGITNLNDMADGVFKERLLSQLSDYGITTRHNRMTVKYEYLFDEGSFLFSATVDYTDLQYHVDYVKINASTTQKISDVNNTEVKLYSPEKYVFLPADTLKEAMSLGAAAITLKRGQESFTVTTFSLDYEGWTNPPNECYFPLIIEESGVYTFTPETNTCALFDSDGVIVYPQTGYLSAGRYYIRINGVLYGKNERRIDVEATYLEDFGDVSNPTPIENGEYDVRFEAIGDRVAFSFTPDKTGLYSLLKYDYVTLYLYTAEDTTTPVQEIWAINHSAILTEGVEYILLFESRDYEPAEFTATVEYIGMPAIPDGLTLTEQWQEVFLWWDGIDKIPVTITEPGEYYVEFKYTAGQEDIGGSFYTLDGKYYNKFKYVYIDGVETKITMLDAGEYYLDVGVYSNMYFKGSIRLVTYAKRVVEQREVEIPTDTYLTLTTSDLPTVYSTSSFTFEVTQECILYWTPDSAFFAILDENGNRISTYGNTVFDEEHQIWVEYSGTLKPGKYTIIFEIDEYAKPGVKTAQIRIKPI